MNMIKFFRKNRQRLLTENKFSKYLIYAIGEIALVMIGILLAVQVNNWNESRKDVKREIKMLNDLQNDINNNIKNINEGIIVLEEGLKHSSKILSAFEKQTKYDSIMNKDFVFYTYYWDPDFRNASFENLKKEGVNLISNDTLRNNIIEIFEIDMDILDVSDLNSHNDYMNSVGNRILNKHLYFDRETGYSLPVNYEKMMSDNEFYSFTSFFLQSQMNTLFKSGKFIEKAQSLNENINEEIQQLQN